MKLDELNFNFDLNKIFEGISDSFFKTVRLIFMMIFNLPTGIKITLAIIFLLVIISIGYLAWKYRDEWRYVKY